MQGHRQVPEMVSKLNNKEDNKMYKHLNVKESLHGDEICTKLDWLHVTPHRMVMLQCIQTRAYTITRKTINHTSPSVLKECLANQL